MHRLSAAKQTSDPDSLTPLPTVSVLIPMRNEERFIGACLDCLLHGDYPADKVEFLVIDGESTDRSCEIVKEYARTDPRIRLLCNPQSISAAALNVGLAEARHEIAVRVDAHALYAPDYVSESVRVLTQVDGVGGAAGEQRAIGVGYWQSAIAASMANPFASGLAKYRKASSACFVDTIFLGAWRRDVALAIGGFDTSWRINADYEFNIRLRKAGLGLYLSPSIKSSYYPRESLAALCKQFYRYGFWRVRTIYAHPKDVQLRHLIPPLFIVALLASAVLVPVSAIPFLIVAGLYAVASIASSIQAAARSCWAYLPALPLVFASMQFSWGVGFLVGLFVWAPQARGLRREKSYPASAVVREAPSSSGAS